MGKKVQISTVRKIKFEDGKELILEDSKTFREKISEDSFYMVFIDYISPFFKIKSDSAKNLLIWLCNNAEFNTGKVSLTTKDRKELASKFKITNSAISRNLKILKDKKLISGDDGSFVIIPQVFWKGESSVRRKILANSEFVVQFGIKPNKE